MKPRCKSSPSGFGITGRIRQQWRVGMLSLMVYATILSVACLLVGQWLVLGLTQQLVRSGSELLGADRIVTHSQPVEGQWLTSVQALDLRQSRSVVFHTMAYAGDAMQLVRVRAVEQNFPLRGQWQRSPEAMIQPGQIWLDAAAQERLGVMPGDDVDLGSATFQVAGLSITEPESRGPGFMFMPKVIIHLDDLASVEAIGPGSRVSYYHLFSGTSQALAALDSMQPSLPQQWRYLSAEQREGQGQAWLTYAQQLIALGVLAITLLCLYTLLVAIKGYLLAQRRLLVVYRTFGASRRRCLWEIYRLMLVSLAVSTLLGVLLAGACYQMLAQTWPQWLALEGGWLEPMVWGLLPIGMACLIAYPGAISLLHTPPRRLLSATIPGFAMTLIWLLVCILMVTLLLRDWQWSAWLIGALVVIWLLSNRLRIGLVWLLKLAPSVSVSWNLALLRLRQHGNTSDTMLVGLVLALGLTSSVWVLQQRLIGQWLQSLPDDAPNHFFINIEPESQPAIWQLADEAGVELSQPFEVVRGRLTAVNGQELCQQDCPEDVPKAPGRELNFTTSAKLPLTNQVVAGQWFEGFATPSVSVEQGFAQRTQIELGDRLTMSIYGREMTLPVTSLRSLNWQSMQPNFFIIFSPGALADSPGMVMASAHIPKKQQAFTHQLRDIDPGVTAIDISQWLGQTQKLLEQLEVAIRAVALLLLLAAGLLLSAQLLMSLSQRRKEVAVMHLLGATRYQLRRSLLLELALLGSVSSVIALGVSESLALGLGYLFELEWTASWGAWILLLLSGPLVVVLAARGFMAHMERQKRWMLQAEYD